MLVFRFLAWWLLFSLSLFSAGAAAKCIEGDCRDGKGVRTFNDGGRYEGEFKNAKFHGLGDYYWPSGNHYNGYWQNGRREGYGRFTWADGGVSEGIWENGKFVQEAPLPAQLGRTTQDAALQIDWLEPDPALNQLAQARVLLRLCVKGESEPELELSVNDLMQTAALSRGYRVVSAQADAVAAAASAPGCDAVIQREITLQAGTNHIQIRVSGAAGATELERNLHYQPGSAQPAVIHPGQRVALLIGNGNYQKMPLRNPVNDATAMADALRGLGFKVLLHTDADAREMRDAIYQFGDLLRADRDSVGLFYFAGHGMQIKGENYLIPLGIRVRSERDVELDAVKLARVMLGFEDARNRMNMIILDACRDNPFANSFKASGTRSMAGQGLSPTISPRGTFIAFAAQPGAVAADGQGEHGLYTEALLNTISRPGLQLEDVFKQVRAHVRTRSQNRQIPWENSSIEGDFYFVR